MKHPRGFSLTELLLALAVIGTLVAVFTSVLHTSGKDADTQTATASLSQTFTAASTTRATWQQTPPECHTTPTNPTDPSLYTPCVLTPHTTGIHLADANEPPNSPHAVSITTTATHLVAVTVPTDPGPTPPTSCYAATYHLTTGEETNWVIPTPGSSCAATEIVPVLTTATCAPASGKNWRTPCRPT